MRRTIEPRLGGQRPDPITLVTGENREVRQLVANLFQRRVTELGEALVRLRHLEGSAERDSWIRVLEVERARDDARYQLAIREHSNGTK